MKLKKEENIKYWHEHVHQASLHKEGFYDYCLEHKISKSAIYRWKKYFLNLSVKKSIQKKRYIKTKNKQSPFLPVIVESSDLKDSNQSKNINLPDPSWLAEVIVKLIQGLS